jgi:hypothetical protein
MKKIPLAYLLSFLICLAVYSGPAAGVAERTFLGVEVVGSRRFTRQEVEGLVNLKANASQERVAAAVKKLQQFFDSKHVWANVQLVAQPENRLAIVVDLTDAGGEPISRRLIGSHHVHTASEKPFILLGQLKERLEVLNTEGRPAREIWRDGLLFYSDEPANQMIEEMQKFLPAMKQELLDVVNSDPDAHRRTQSIELLSWYPGENDVPKSLLSALSDVDANVRLAGTRYLYPRLNSLGDDFPYDELLQGLASMLERPSHQDRSKSLYCLLKVCRARPETIPTAKNLCEKAVDALLHASILPSVKETSGQLEALFSAPANSFTRPSKEEGSDEPDF